MKGATNGKFFEPKPVIKLNPASGQGAHGADPDSPHPFDPARARARAAGLAEGQRRFNRGYELIFGDHGWWTGLGRAQADFADMEAAGELDDIAHSYGLRDRHALTPAHKRVFEAEKALEGARYAYPRNLLLQNELDCARAALRRELERPAREKAAADVAAIGAQVAFLGMQLQVAELAKDPRERALQRRATRSETQRRALEQRTRFHR